MIHTLQNMIGNQNTKTRDDNGNYVRAVPLPFHGGIIQRLVSAWWVVVGKAYAVQWPKPGELEKLIHD